MCSFIVLHNRVFTAQGGNQKCLFLSFVLIVSFIVCAKKKGGKEKGKRVMGNLRLLLCLKSIAMPLVLRTGACARRER